MVLRHLFNSLLLGHPAVSRTYVESGQFAAWRSGACRVASDTLLLRVQRRVWHSFDQGVRYACPTCRVLFVCFWFLNRYEVSGLSPGAHGLHIYDGPAFHAGQSLGNIIADASGRANGTLESAFVRVMGKDSIVGKLLLVHGEASAKRHLVIQDALGAVAGGVIVKVDGDFAESRGAAGVSAGVKRLLRLVRPLPVLGGSVAVWVIWFCYQMGRTQLPSQLLPCPPISLFTFQQPQQPIYAAVMCFAAVLFVSMTSILHMALEPFVAGDTETRTTLKSNFWWGIVAFVGAFVRWKKLRRSSSSLL